MRSRISRRRVPTTLADRVRSRCPRWAEQGLHANGFEDGVEGADVFTVPVPDEEAHQVHAALQGHGEVPGLLSGPRGGGVGGDVGEVEAPGAVFDEDQGMEALEEDGVDVEEVGRDDAVGLGGEELVPGRPQALWGGVDAGGVKDFPNRGRGNRVAQAGEFALYPPLAPLPFSRAKRRMRCLRWAWWRVFLSGGLGERPFAGQELTVPGKHCGGGDREDVAAQNGSGHRDQIPDQCSDDRQRHPRIAPERSKPRRQDQQTSRPQPESYFRAGQD